MVINKKSNLEHQLDYFKRRMKNYVNIKSGLFKKVEINLLFRTVSFVCLSCGKFLGQLNSTDEMQPFELYMHPICSKCFKEKIGKIADHLESPWENCDKMKI